MSLKGNTTVNKGESDDDGLPINVLINTVVSNQTSTNAVPPQLIYDEPRNQPYLRQCEKYSCSIIRFYLDSFTLPLWCPIIQINQTNPLLTIYSVSLSWTDPSGGAVYDQQEYLIYDPQVLAIPVPTKVNGQQQDNTSQFYNVYTMQALIKMFNTTFATCMTNLNAQVTAAGSSLPSTNPPILTIDLPSCIATLNIDVTGYDDLSANSISVFFNPASFNLFNSFPFKVISWTDTATNGKNMKLVVNAFGGQDITQFPSYDPSYNVFQVSQEYDSLTTAANPVSAVTITSSKIPIRATDETSPTIFNNGSIFTNSGNNSSTNPIISDFVADNFRPFILYNPTSEFLFHDVISSGDLRNIQFAVYWKDRYSNYFPVFLPATGTFSIKFLFTKTNRRFPRFIAN